MTKTIATILFLINSLAAYGQIINNCTELSTLKPHINNNKELNRDSLIALDLEIIYKCTTLDSFDLKFLNPKTLSILFVDMVERNNEIRYAGIIESIENIIHETNYLNLKSTLLYFYIHQDEIINKKGRKEIFKLAPTKYNANKISEEIVDFIYKKENRGRTYKEALQLYIWPNNILIYRPELNKNTTVDPRYQFNRLKSLSDLKNTTNDKDNLIYFSSWTDVNCRKFEVKYFMDSHIQSLFSKYNCFICYIDESEEATPAQKAAFPEKNIITEGNYIIEIEKSLTPQFIQPQIAITNRNFELIRTYLITKTNNELDSFLNK